jgi:hypothetical protein
MRAPVTVSRAPAPQRPSSAAANGHGGGTSSGSDGDAAYHELLRRLHEEQEQLGQLIQHPF